MNSVPTASQVAPISLRSASAGHELAFIGFVLWVYLLCLQLVDTMGEWGYRWAYLAMLPSLWLLSATMFWVNRFRRTSDYYHASSKACRRSGIAIIIISLIFGWFVESVVAISSQGDLDNSYRTVVNLVILVPFAEEYFFRGLVFDHLVRNLGRFSGVIMVSVLFAFLHAPQGIFIQMFIFSVLLCLVTLKTKNVLATGTIHLGWNLLVFYYQFSKTLTNMATPF